MGIDKFYSTFLKKSATAKDPTEDEKHYSGTMDNNSSLSGTPISELHIDVNTIIYEAVNAVYLKGQVFGKADVGFVDKVNKRDKESVKREVFSLIADLIEGIIKEFDPTDLVSVNIDGCPPWAKVMQQKQRRYLSALGLTRDATFDTNAITSGSLWMQDLDKYLGDKVAVYSMQETSPKKIIYSSHLVSGEGEHKLMRTMKSITRTITSSGAVIVYGNDSDLVLLCMLTDVSNLYVCRGLKFERITERARILRLEPERQSRLNIVNISAMRSSVESHLEAADMKQSVIDFVTLMSLVGNDFIPRPFAYEDVGETIFNAVVAYKLVGEPLVVAGKMMWDSLYKILEYLAYGGDGVIGYEQMAENRARILGERSLLVTSSVVDDEFDYDIFDANWYENALGKKTSYGPEVRMYDTSTQADMCSEFLSGMSWTLTYYTTMSQASNTWYYPYHYAPSIIDVHEYMKEYPSALFDVPSSTETVTVLHQLAAVMPCLSLQYVPPEIRPLWRRESVIADTIPSLIVVDRDEPRQEPPSITYMRQDVVVYTPPDEERKSVAIVPFVDFWRIEEALQDFLSLNSLRHLTKQAETRYYTNTNWSPTRKEKEERKSSPPPPGRFVSRQRYGGAARGGYYRGRGRARGK